MKQTQTAWGVTTRHRAPRTGIRECEGEDGMLSAGTRDRERRGRTTKGEDSEFTISKKKHRLSCARAERQRSSNRPSSDEPASGKGLEDRPSAAQDSSSWGGRRLVAEGQVRSERQRRRRPTASGGTMGSARPWGSSRVWPGCQSICSPVAKLFAMIKLGP